MHRRLLLLAALGLGACSASTTASPPSTEPPPSAAEAAVVDGFLEDLLTATEADGGIVAVVAGDADPVVAVEGTAGPGGAPLTADAPVLVASITKSYVAAAVLSLVADGELSLDDTLAQWVDWPGGDEITLRALLGHTAGVAPFGNDGEAVPLFSQLVVEGPRQWSIPEILDRTRDLPPAGPPGTAAYTNLGYVLVGAVVEEVTGQPLATVLDERVFGPAGLDATWYPPAGPGDRPPVPGTWEVDPSLPVVSTVGTDMTGWQTVAGPAAGAVSDLDDLLRWAEVLLADERLGELDLSEMNEIGDQGYGLGVVGVAADGACIFEGCPPGLDYPYRAVNGDLAGSSTRVLHDPGSDTTIVVYLDRNALSLDEPMLALLAELTG